MNFNKSGLKLMLFLFLIVILFFLPVVIKPQNLLARNNDLTEFRNNYIFFRQQILDNHHLPLWQNRILSGSPFLGDPQNPLLYLPNYALLFLPINVFLFLFFLFHFSIALISMFYLAKKLGLSILPAIIAATVYAFSPKFIAHLEAGHINMLISFAWFPALLYAIFDLAKKPKLASTLLLAFAASSIFLNYVTILIYAVFSGLVFFLINFNKQMIKSTVIHLFIASLIFLAITLPQLTVFISYLPLTTRNLITVEDVGPKIISTRRFVKSIINPYADGLNELSAETVVNFGFIPLFLLLIGFFLVKPKTKILVVIVSFISLFLALGTKTSLYILFLKIMPILKMMRITTRFWFVTILAVALISGYTAEKIKNKALTLLLFLLVIFDLFIFSQNYFKVKNYPFSYPASLNRLIALSTKDPGYYRLYCPTTCLKDVNQEGKGLATGYNPIQLGNFYYFIQKAAGFKFGSYAVSLPPYQTFVDQPQPKSELMGMLGVRYLISPYEFFDNGFSKIIKDEAYYLYQNTKELPRVYLINNQKVTPIKPDIDLPGYLEIPVNKNLGKLVISEIYTPFWTAKDEQGNSLEVNEEQNIILNVNIDQPTNKVKVIFKPRNIDMFLLISFITSAATLFFLGRNLIKNKKFVD